MIDFQELPRKDGAPLGKYMLRYSTITVAYHDAKLVDGLTTEPISGRAMQRLRMAYGPTVQLAPGDDETCRLIAAHLVDHGKPERAAEVLQAFGINDAPEEEVEKKAAEEGAALAAANAEPEGGKATAVVEDDLTEIEDLAVLGAIATSLGLVPGNKQAKALKKLIRAERAARSADAAALAAV